jgi:type IV pilus assembly protein PilA
MKKPQGFTLIELMIVVAIIGILAAVALPAYSDYTKRAHVAEGLSLASAGKTAVSEFWATNGHYPTGTDYNASVGLPPPNRIRGNAVTSVKIISSGIIQIEYNEKVQSGLILAMEPSITDGALLWKCGKRGSRAKRLTTVNDTYLPSSCRY